MDVKGDPVQKINKKMGPPKSIPDPHLNMQPAMPGKVQEGEHAPSPSCTTPGNLLSRRGGGVINQMEIPLLYMTLPLKWQRV